MFRFGALISVVDFNNVHDECENAWNYPTKYLENFPSTCRRFMSFTRMTYCSPSAKQFEGQYSFNYRLKVKSLDKKRINEKFFFASNAKWDVSCVKWAVCCLSMLDVDLERVENHESLDRQCGPEFHSKLFINHPINSNEKKRRENIQQWKISKWSAHNSEVSYVLLVFVMLFPSTLETLQENPNRIYELGREVESVWNGVNARAAASRNILSFARRHQSWIFVSL